MKLANGEIITTTELMKDLFGMNDRLIYNMTEKARYEVIYDYLMEADAEKLERKKDNDNTSIAFILRDEVYLIPEEIFDEADEEWVNEVKAEDEKKAVES